MGRYAVLYISVLPMGKLVCCFFAEYYTGSLILGIFNGPSDGILVTMGLTLMPVFFGANAVIVSFSDTF